MTLPLSRSDVSAVSKIKASLRASFHSAPAAATPYTHWIARAVLPDDVAADICALPFPAPLLEGESGKRDNHNASRTYFDSACQVAHPVAAAVAEAFQSGEIITLLEDTFGASLENTYLRAEYAQDVDGFWLEPHSDLGVKRFTLLLYLSDDPRHASLGTDIYDAEKIHVGSSPFARNVGLIFVPADNTIHGFERRPIHGVRKSLIVNYVSNEWRAREQLAFPENPVGRG